MTRREWFEMDLPLPDDPAARRRVPSSIRIAGCLCGIDWGRPTTTSADVRDRPGRGFDMNPSLPDDPAMRHVDAFRRRYALPTADAASARASEHDL